MDEQQSALAYARAYELFSQIYRQGLDDDIAALLGIESDAHYGAEHYQLFIHNVFPYETIFLDDDGLLGGTITENVAVFYHRIGFHSEYEESPDHISTQLEAMAYLCYAEYDAVADNQSHHIHRLRQLQRNLLDNYLLRWLPAFMIAVEQQKANSYTGVVRQSFELVCTHRAQLGDDLMAAVDPFTLVSPPDLIMNEKTSLRDIARYLLTPAYTGFYLSVDDIRRIGATYRVPHGFGKRQQILTNLLRTASDYDVFPEIVATFKSIATTWRDAFNTMDTLPHNISNVWMTRLQETSDLLDKIEHLARSQNLIMDEEETELAVAGGKTGAGCAVEKDGLDDSTC